MLSNVMLMKIQYFPFRIHSFSYDKCIRKLCLGRVHTSVTLSFHPQNMSTVVLRITRLFIDATTLPFDFADAQCPPSWLGESTLSFVWQKCYNPLIAPPPDLTLIDPAWNKCLAADFQGFDPPRILGPASSLVAPASSEDPDITTIAASPVPSVKSPPVQTNPNSEPSLMASPDPVVGSPRAPDSPSMMSNSPTPHPNEKHPAASRTLVVSTKDVDKAGSRIPQSPPVQTSPNSEPSLMPLPDQVVGFPRPPDSPSRVSNPPAAHSNIKNPEVSGLNSAVQPTIIFTTEVDENGSQIPRSTTDFSDPDVEISTNTKPNSAQEGESITLATQGSAFSSDPAIRSLDSDSDPISSHPGYSTTGQYIHKVPAAFFVVGSQTLTPDGVITASYL